jgi:hypothetical protein
MLDAVTQAEQRLRLHAWHQKVHVMHVAHMKAAVVCDRLGRGVGVFAAILATFTGATWVSDLTAVVGSSDVLLWLAAGAAILSGVLVAINTTMNWPKRAAEHQAASARYGTLRHEMEVWRVEHPCDDTPPADVAKAWMQRWAEAEEKPPVVGWRALRHATKYVTDQPVEVVW